MSLLIKALEKAEQGKTADSGQALSLEPYATKNSEASPSIPPSAHAKETQKQDSQKIAAKVFSSKSEINRPSKNKVLWISAALFLVLAVICLQFYSYLNSFNKPEIILARPATILTPAPATSNEAEPAAAVVTKASPGNAGSSLVTESAANTPVVATNTANPTDNTSQPNAVPLMSGRPETSPSASINKNAPASVPASEVAANNIQDGNNAKAQTPRSNAVPAKSKQYAFGEAIPDNAGMKITRNLLESGINPNLLSAYQAFSRGDDAAAQRNYRLVLQGDVRNTDALLGMAAIAARQNRNNDAIGWYGKVLEVEPRNSVAQVAMVNLLAQADPVSSESRIKSLIAQQPEAAHLHASLGNLYAAQDQWPAAQQAYFQAHHFDPNNSEYAFNLAVSLEQLGKPALALPYYQRALELLKSGPANSGSSAIDRAQLESRIMQLQ